MKGSLQIIEQVIDRQSKHPEIYFYKGVILEKLGRYNEALEALETNFLINKDSKSLSTKANILLKLKRFKEALETYDEILSVHSSNLSALIGKGNLLNDLERYSESLQHYDKALEINLTNIDALNNKGIFLYNLFQSRKTLDISEVKIIEPPNPTPNPTPNHPTSPPSPYQQSMECFDKTLAIDPSNVQALTYKGIFIMSYVHIKRQ